MKETLTDKQHPYIWNERLMEIYDECPEHKQIVREDGTKAFCRECGKPICENCGLCFND